MEKKNRVKIFSIYHAPGKLFNSEIIEPIQSGCSCTDLDLNILKDNSGDNISSKNQYYAELTVQYWV